MRYETSFKELILGAEEEILSLIIGLNLKILEVKNVEFPQVREKRVDKLYISEYNGKKFVLHIEFQLYYQKWFPIRMLSYFVDIKNQFPDTEMWQIVFTLGQITESSLVQKTPVGGIEYSFKVIDLSKIPSEIFLSSSNPNINAFGILSSDIDVKRLIQKLSSYNLDEDKFLSILSKIYLLSFAVKRDKEVLKAMEDFSTIDITKTELFKMGEEKGLKEGIEKGLKEGIEKGLKEGIEKGQKVGMIEAILLGMKIKFGSRAKAMIKKIKEIDDLEKLKRIKKAIIKAKSIKDIEKILENSSKEK